MLFQTNSKLKEEEKPIYKYSLPAFETCPGAGACVEWCMWRDIYRLRGQRCIDAHKRNLEIMKKPFFVDMAVFELEQNPRIDLLRWCDSGDVPSQILLDKITSIASQTVGGVSGGVFHYCYSKSLHLDWSGFKSLPNTKMIQSYGGKYDNLIDKRSAHAVVIAKGKRLAGYVDASNSDLKAVRNNRITLSMKGKNLVL